MKNYRLTLFFLLFSTLVTAQGTGIPLGNPAYHIMDRLEIKTGIPAPFHSALKYYLRGDVTQYALTIDTAHIPLTHLDRFDLYYIFKDNNEWLASSKFPTTLGGKREPVFKMAYTDSTNTFYTLEGTQMEASFKDARFIETEKPLLKSFYKTPANFYEVNNPYFQFRINPILNFKLAKQNGDSGTFFYNQRGLEIRGGIDDRIYFYTNILETQAHFPDYVNEFIENYGAIPGNGFFKNYESSLFNVSDGFDFLNAQAYIAFNVTKHVGLQFGHGRNFIGNGYRSLLLSDFSNNYFYLKLNWRVWRFHYQNIFAELAADSRGGGKSGVGPKKYMAAHHLSFNITDNLNIGFFEVTIFNLDKGRDQFELQYLNPVILYRTVEQLLGSPDNVLIGFDFKWNFLRRYQLYAQLMLDEFKFDELILNRDGWWGNKFGLQAGLKYIDAFGIDHLDLQAEFNTVRPYTYSHRDTLGASYTNFKQALAHPLGANFREFLFILRYQPFKKWTVDARFIRAEFGEDSDGLNWGGDISISHKTRVMDFGNEIAQGVGTTTALLGIDVSYQFWHNMFLDLNFFYRKKNSDLDERDTTTKFFGGGIRMNIGKMRMDF